MKDLWRKAEFRLWLSIIGTATILLTSAFAMVQQSTRLAADDLPIVNNQIIRKQLDKGLEPADVIPAIKSDLAKDSVPFAIITDSSGTVLASNAVLDGKSPVPPKGVFEYTRAHGVDRFTWQPAENARLATRVIKYGNGEHTKFVITGQSLKEPENRIKVYAAVATLSWFAMLLLSFLTIILPSTKRVKS